MHEKVTVARDRMIEAIVDARHCDTLREREELRRKLRSKSDDELEKLLQRETTR